MRATALGIINLINSFNTPPIMDRSFRDIINKEIADLNNTIDQIDLHMQNIPSNGRTHILLKHTQYLF